MKQKDIKADGKTWYAVDGSQERRYITTQAVVIGFGWQKHRHKDWSTDSYNTPTGKGVAIAVEVRDFDSDDEGAQKWEPRVVPLSHIQRTWQEQKKLEKQYEKDSRAAAKVREAKEKKLVSQGKRILKKFAKLGLTEDAPSVHGDRATYYSIGDLEKLLDRLITAEEKR